MPLVRLMMSVQLNNPVKYLRGVGPQRAAALEERGIATVGDLLGYLPFRYEDRIRFTKIAEIIPGQVQTILAEVASGGGSTVRFRGGRGPVFHVMVRDASGSLHARFFHGAYLEGRLKEGQRLVLHGKAEFDPYRPGRMEMVNPQIEILSGSGGGAPADSTEVGRIVPVYEAIGAISSRMLRRIIYAVLLNFDGNIPDPLPEEIRARYRFPSRREALLAVHFPEKNEDVERLNTFRSPAHIRLIFEEFFTTRSRWRCGARRITGSAGSRCACGRKSARGAEADFAVQADGRAEARAGRNRGRPRKAVSDAPAARGGRRQRENDCGARGTHHRDRKRLPGGADGADRNSGDATFSFGEATVRAAWVRG